MEQMKRSEFLKKLGIGLGVAVVAPTLLAENSIKKEINTLAGEPTKIWYDEYLNKAGITMGETRFVGMRCWDRNGNVTNINAH